MAAKKTTPEPDEDFNDADLHVGPPHPGCSICRLNLPFDLPDELVAAVAERRVVIFAGAGASTENGLVTKLTMYEDLRTDPKVDLPEGSAFPAVMAKFVEVYGRTELLQYILRRLDLVRAIPQSEKLASRFHFALAPIPQLDQILTTNWDTYFERYTRALPIVTDADFAFWDLPRRKVFKVHGSIENVSTIIATTGDYERRTRELSHGLMGATLRLALATKTVVFVGYSLADSDFQQIYRYLAREMGDILPRSYIVSPSNNPTPRFVTSKRIRTDGTYFIAKLRAALVRGGHMLSDRRVGDMYLLRSRLDGARKFIEQIPLQRYPSVIYSISYQDGLAHSLDRAMSEWSTGKYHDPVWLDEQAHGYLVHWLRGAVKNRRYEDAAYVEGFAAGFVFMRGGIPLDAVPLLYLPGVGAIASVKNFGRQLQRAARLHASANRRAQRIANELAPGIMWHHTTELLGAHPI